MSLRARDKRENLYWAGKLKRKRLGAGTLRAVDLSRSICEIFKSHALQRAETRPGKRWKRATVFIATLQFGRADWDRRCIPVEQLFDALEKCSGAGENLRIDVVKRIDSAHTRVDRQQSDLRFVPPQPLDQLHGAGRRY